MENEITKNDFGSFALRKIPVTVKDNNIKPLDDNEIDKIKILEFSNVVDKWEQEVLFNEKGFYYLKGKEAYEKEKEYKSELKKFIESKINEMSFTSGFSKDIAYKIKREKLLAVTEQMEIYAKEQLNEWETSTYEEALDFTIKRAVLYKQNIAIVDNSLKNGLKILEFISNKEDWSKKLYNYRRKEFVSNFYIALINEFLRDKDVLAYQYFNKYKEVINQEGREKLEKQVKQMRVNVIANNWAKEIFSYGLEKSEFEKELNDIEEEEIKEAAKDFYNDLKTDEIRQKALEEKGKNIENWKEVMNIVREDINKAALYIDYSSKKESIRLKSEYIRQMSKTGAVKTDVKEFLSLFEKAFENFQIFKDMDISDYRGCLSSEDFEIFEKLQNGSEKEFIQTRFELKYILNLLKGDDEKYNFIKMYFTVLSEYKNADFDKRNKIIKCIFEQNTSSKEQEGKADSKNDSIIN